MTQDKKRKSTTTKKRKQIKKKTRDPLSSEIVAILHIACSLLMGIGIYMHGGGIVGGLLRNLLIRIFGVSAYIIPTVIFIYGILLLSKKIHKGWSVYHTRCLVTILFISTLAQTIFYATEKPDSIKEALLFAYTSMNVLGGGGIGAIFSIFFIKLLGIYGAFIFYVTMLLIWGIIEKNISVSQVLEEILYQLRYFIQKQKEFRKQRVLKCEGKNNASEKVQKESPILREEKAIQEPVEISIMDFSQKNKSKENIQQNNQSDEVKDLTLSTEAAQRREADEEIQISYTANSPDTEVGLYEFPSIDLLKLPPKNSVNKDHKKQMMGNAQKLEEVLQSFGVEAKVVQVSRGPAVTRYELQPGIGVKVSKIANLSDDIALNLAAAGIRIEAPIPGKAAVGIEVPNQEVSPVYFREVIESRDFQDFESKLAFGLGKDIAGNTVVADIAKMPHLLIAGATGSGKSVCINTLINSIIFKANPEEVKLLMVDPKVVELSIYNGIPHLLIPVVTDPKKAAGALNWAVAEMVRRYQLFSEHNVRDMKGYNALKSERGEAERLPQIVIIIDELADLMMVAPGEVEDAICRLAQMARAAGLHLVIATQRPSVDVITGVIKANIPSRIAFSVSSQVDSRTILDMAGAEKLLGKGDMLFYPMGAPKPQRIQGAFISDKEVEAVVAAVKKKENINYDESIMNEIHTAAPSNEVGEDYDELLYEAVQFVIEKEKASISMLQRAFRIGYNRAARLVDQMEKIGIIGGEDGSKPRKVLINLEQYEAMKDSLQQEQNYKNA